MTLKKKLSQFNALKVDDKQQNCLLKFNKVIKPER
jgi:hypothetical protein